MKANFSTMSLRIRELVLSLIVAGCLFPASAATYYVATNGIDAVGRGSEESPFETIQYAIDSAAAGSTIYVKPGIYDKGGAENASANGVHSNRVVLTKRISLMSTGGAAVTHIVGAPDPDTGGVGPNAIRCIVSPNNDSADSTISGFTLRDGYGDDGTENHRSGGFLQYNGNKWILISDCVISNCAAFTYGGARGGTFARCLFAKNIVTSNHGSTGAGVGVANLVNCIITGNGDSDSDHAVDNATLVNCTVICNRGYGIRHNTSGPTSCKLYNTVVCCNLKADGSNDSFTNCVVGGYPVVSPLDDDYRVVSGGEADMSGDSAHLTGLKDVLGLWVPNHMKELDFYGNTIDLVAEKVHAGAVQDSAAIKGGAIYMRGPLSCGGYSSSSGLPIYAQSTNGLTQWKVKFADRRMSGAEMKYLRYIHSRLEGSATYRSLGYDNTMVFSVPMKPGLVSTNNPEYSKALWVDSKSGSDDVNDGSESSPFATIQKAVDVGGAGTVVYLAPGLYDKGGMAADDPAAATFGLSRVWITNSHVRIVGTAGPEETIIAGAPDPVTGGFGPGAVRGLLTTNSIVNVQGVTISNCWTHAEMTTAVTTNHLKGCAVRRIALGDSIVTDCHGCSSVLAFANASRCRVYGNEAKGNSLFSDDGRIVSSWIGPNTSRSSTYYGYLGSGVQGWFCTIVVDNGQSAFSQNAQLHNSIAVGGKYVRKDMGSTGNVFWNFENVQDEASGTFASPRFTADRLHVKSTSPALTAGVAPSVEGYAANDPIAKVWNIIATTDIDGRLVCFNADGTAMAGAAHETVPAVRTFYITVR